MKFLLDSVILIDHLNGIKAAHDWLSRYHTNANISVITRAEVLAGANENNVQSVKALLDSFSTLPMTIEDADLAAQLRQKNHWKLPDAIQAAIAVRHNLLLVTRNTKDFSEKHNFVHTPYVL